ncbi:hypothetical protein L1049_019384 [Liquidambar formosana]|uniref:Transposase n=1 Tax=Liquidambar formosana TaxID=63359 RepID=A0AAP0SBA8_LIQFO
MTGRRKNSDSAEQKYKLAESRRKMNVQKMGKHLRDYKSLLTKLIRDLAQGDDATNELALAKPTNLTPNEWVAFIKGWLSSEFNGKSKIFKEMRKKQDLPHTMSRKGYARLEDDMRKKADNVARVDVWIRGHSKKGGEFINDLVVEVVSKLEEYPHEPTSTIKNDPITKVIGPEHRGWVRGMGFGATPSKVDAEIEKDGTVRQLQSKVHSLELKVQELTNNLEQQVQKLTYIVTHGRRPNEKKETSGS